MKLNNSFRHILNIPVRFSDLDAMGHVNNASYLTFYEEARTAWFRDCTMMPHNSIDYPTIVARVEVDYLLPISLGQQIYVATRCTAIGKKSMTLEGMISLGPSMKYVASKYTCIMVYYDYQKGISMPVPQDFKDQVFRYESGN